MTRFDELQRLQNCIIAIHGADCYRDMIQVGISEGLAHGTHLSINELILRLTRHFVMTMHGVGYYRDKVKSQ